MADIDPTEDSQDHSSDLTTAGVYSDKVSNWETVSSDFSIIEEEDFNPQQTHVITSTTEQVCSSITFSGLSASILGESMFVDVQDELKDAMKTEEDCTTSTDPSKSSKVSTACNLSLSDESKSNSKDIQNMDKEAPPKSSPVITPAHSMDSVYRQISNISSVEWEKDLLAECEKWRGKLLHRLAKFKDMVPNVLLVGLPGVGKSSFVNSVEAAVSNEWHEHAYTGHHGKNEDPVTACLRVYPVVAPGCESDNPKVLFNIMDMPGLANEKSRSIEEVIRAINHGRIPADHSVLNILSLGQENGSQAIRDRYSEKVDHLKIQRVVFVASAEDSLPEKLITCTLKASRPSVNTKRAIPVFGLMTKMDLVITPPEVMAHARKECAFTDALGFRGAKHRYASCRNYSDATTPDMVLETYPEIDLGILKFLYVLLDPAYKATEDTTPLHTPSVTPHHSRKNSDAAQYESLRDAVIKDASVRLREQSAKGPVSHSSKSGAQSHEYSSRDTKDPTLSVKEQAVHDKDYIPRSSRYLVSPYKDRERALRYSRHRNTIGGSSSSNTHNNKNLRTLSYCNIIAAVICGVFYLGLYSRFPVPLFEGTIVEISLSWLLLLMPFFLIIIYLYVSHNVQNKKARH